MTDISLQPREHRNLRMALVLAGVVAGMVGLAFAAVPLYDMFCRATGLGGTTQVASGNPKGVIDREMTVRFDSNIDANLAWTVKPAAPVTARIGTVETVNFIATNNSHRTLTGRATFNVTPEQTGIYFNKIECFCFTEQTLRPGESVAMPVVFFVDPDLARDRNLDAVREITLSYTFYAENTEES
ncbi:MAG TPA: cytochrome c oxidase assembly protein [Alphaproteobacteria bacterium]|nr:cytochrome c oxidase assembly protein [Alphaproteobacteria bacterium]